MWYIASSPFWLLGLWCMWQAGGALVDDLPNESRQRRNERMFWNLVAGGFMFYIAARIAS